MTRMKPPAGTPVATGVANGSLGTGTAVDEETTIMAVPEAPEATEPPKAAAKAPTTASARAAAPAPAAAAAPRAIATSAATTALAAEPVPAERRAVTRRDPYRPIGIALAAILVALAGLAVLSSGGDAPIDAGAAPSASQTIAPGASSDAGAGAGGDQDDGDGDGQRGNCNGRGNDPCDREDGGGD